MLYMIGMVIRKLSPPPPNGHRKIAPNKFPAGLGLVFGLGLESGAIFRAWINLPGGNFSINEGYLLLYSVNDL